ncbi:MAG: methyltransferase domain-containing protein [Proteobacteria bacterium]|nr:methyltransferase domain-containing protein [Pseudomonadota bacterium]
MSAWDPDVYLKFGGERTRAAADLLARVPLSAPKHIVDLGCGPGNSTALIASRYPNADILGVDSDEAMLAKARAEHVQARFEPGDFETWTPHQAPDLIYTNAALHWAADPLAVAARLFQSLAPGGALALQVPQNFDKPSHVAMRAAAQDGPWAEKLRDAFQPLMLGAQDYAGALAPLGAKLDVWSTAYLHILEGEDAVLKWISGSALRPYFARLRGNERTGFEADLAARLRRAYPPEIDGRTYFPFHRVFAIASKGA